MVGSSPLLALAFCVACIFGQLFELAQAQNRTQAATDPAEGVTLYLSLSLTHTHTHTHTHTKSLLHMNVLGWSELFLSSAYVKYEQQYETSFLFLFFCILGYNPINKQRMPKTVFVYNCWGAKLEVIYRRLAFRI